MAERRPASLAASLAEREWLDALRNLSLCCAIGDADEVHERLREMNALLLAAPSRLLISGLRPLPVHRTEALIDADACETAVLNMLDDGCGFLLSRGAQGQSLVTIALPGSADETSGSAATPALALIGTIALALARAVSRGARSQRQIGRDAGALLH